MKPIQLNKKKYCLIVLDGNLTRNLIRNFISQNSPKNQFIIIAADGASTGLKKYGVIPNYIIGDLDSSTNKVLEHFRKKGTDIIKISEQEHNDFEKSLNYSISKGYTNIAVVGYGGKRIDHTLNNFSVLLKFDKKVQIKFFDDIFEIYLLNRINKIKYSLNEPISLIALSNTTGINTSGLMYPLKNGTLEIGKKEGALNKSTSKTIKIEFKTGSLLIIKKHFSVFKFSK